MSEDLDRRFDFHSPPNAYAVEAHEDIRAKAKELAEFVEIVAPAGRERSLAITKIEEAMMWANAAIARGWGCWKDTNGDGNCPEHPNGCHPSKYEREMEEKHGPNWRHGYAAPVGRLGDV